MYLTKRTVIVTTIILLTINCAFGAIVSWGERCEYTEECGDHRLVCQEVTVKNISQKLCVCDRFHEWNGTLIGCSLTVKAEDILALLQEKYNVSGRIEYEANIVYTAQVVAGMFVLAVGLICSVFVTVYCYRMWKQDSELDDIVLKLESQIAQNKATTSRSATAR